MNAVIVASAIAVIGCGGSHSTSAYATSVGRMTKLESGLLLYLNDYDEQVPMPTNWVEGMTRYVANPSSFHSPSVRLPGYGYAMNALIAGHSYYSVPNPDQVIAFFDSKNLVKDATDSLSTMPSPPRYGTKNTLGYLDGRTQDEVIASKPPLQPAQVSLNRVKQLAVGLSIYANDWDSMFPQAGTWADGLGPYIKNPELFRSPAIEKTSPTLYGYAFNSDTAGKGISDIASPSATYGIFDSTDLKRNATDLPSTVPSPGRYHGKNTISFLDGHTVLK